MLVLVAVIILGLFCIFCAIKNYDWFINNILTRSLLELLGKKAIRLFYILFGSLLIALNIFLYFFLD